MSLLIKGMEMPENCDTCPLSKWDSTNEKFYCMFDNCPLVEVPAPHGRLIDEDNVIDAIHERLQVLRTHKQFIKKHGDIDLLGVMPYIAEIPTVIEAEGEDE